MSIEETYECEEEESDERMNTLFPLVRVETHDAWSNERVNAGIKSSVTHPSTFHKDSFTIVD